MILRQRKNIDSPWHPDFRDAEALPDVKLVRTDFLLNCLGAAVFIIAGIFFVTNFMMAKSIQDNIDIVSQDLDKKKSLNKNAFIQNKDFYDKSSLVTIFNKYCHPSIDPLEFLISIAQNKNKELIFHRISFEEKTEALSRNERKKRDPKKIYIFNIEGTIQGSYDDALDILNDYMDQVAGIPSIKDSIEEIEMVSLKRDKLIELFTYQIDITVDPV